MIGYIETFVFVGIAFLALPYMFYAIVAILSFTLELISFHWLWKK